MITALRHWWQKRTGQVDTPLDGEVPFWFVSLAFHLLLLVLLAKILMPKPVDDTVFMNVDNQDIELPDEAVPDIQFEEVETAEVGAESENALEEAVNEAVEFEEDPLEDPVEIEIPETEFGDLLVSDVFEPSVAENVSTLNIKGTAGASVQGASGAVDRITEEILLSLGERKTTVVWLFDQSASLLRQREEIVQRFDRIYQELGMIEESGHDAFKNHSDIPLLTQVCGFGSNFTAMLDRPSDSLKDIKDAINKIPRDDTGLEYVFSAVIETVNRFKEFREIKKSTGERDRNVMIIIVSDEAGDDRQRVDEAIANLKKYEVPVYVIGIPAPFGREATEVKWVDPDPEFDQQVQWAPVNQGPESIMPERLQLEFTGGDFRDLSNIDSGFGPFALTRMAYESGGIYFAVHPNRRVGRRVQRWETAEYSASLEYFFDQQIMRPYKPDYVSLKTYNKRVQENKARFALVNAAQNSRTGALEAPRMRFPKTDEANFVRIVSRAQQDAAILEPKMNRLYGILQAGESDRSKENSLRWQAGFDLAYGRVIAAMIRAESYNAMLALAKTKLKFENPENNTWVLVADDSISTGGKQAKLAAKAKEYLNRVIDEHPGTPWAMLAERELKTPIGWRWKDAYTRPREERMNNNNNNNAPDPTPMENETPKTKRPPPKL